jgi:transposase
MQLKTILNRVQKIKSFVYGAVRWVEGAPSPTLEVEVHARANSRPVCSGCGQSGPGYDRLPARRFEFFLYPPKALRPCNPGSCRFGA